MTSDGPRISDTPLYDEEMFRDLEDDFKPDATDSPIYSPKLEMRDLSLEEIREEPHFSLMPPDLKIMETTGLTKRHRFFKIKVRPEAIHQAQEAIQAKLKELVERYNG